MRIWGEPYPDPEDVNEEEPVNFPDIPDNRREENLQAAAIIRNGLSTFFDTHRL